MPRNRIGTLVFLTTTCCLSSVDSFVASWIAPGRETSRSFQRETAVQTIVESSRGQESVAQLQKEIVVLQEQLRHDLLQGDKVDDIMNNQDQNEDIAQALLQAKLELTAAEIQLQQEQAVQAHEEMEDAIRQVRNAFILREQATQETRAAIDEATWLESIMNGQEDDSQSQDLQTLLLAHAAHDVKATHELWQQATVSRIQALGKEVKAKDQLWSLQQRQEFLQRLQDSHDAAAVQQWAARELPRSASVVPMIKKRLAARDEIV